MAKKDLNLPRWFPRMLVFALDEIEEIENISGIRVFCDKSIWKEASKLFMDTFTDVWWEDVGGVNCSEEEKDICPVSVKRMEYGFFITVGKLYIKDSWGNYGARTNADAVALETMKAAYPELEYEGHVVYVYSDVHTGEIDEYWVSSSGKNAFKRYDFIGKGLNRILSEKEGYIYYSLEDNLEWGAGHEDIIRLFYAYSQWISENVLDRAVHWIVAVADEEMQGDLIRRVKELEVNRWSRVLKRRQKGDFRIDEDGVLREYNGPGGDVAIPEGVTRIGSWVFGKCESLKSVTMPRGLKSIGNYVFCGCSGLERVIIPKSVKRIGMGAFQNCSSLKNVEIPKSIKKVGMDAFEGCGSLQMGERGTIDPKAKVELLEKAVLEDGPDELRAVIDRERPFEFMARALGYACAFGGEEKVEILLESGADFTYEPGPGSYEKYGTYDAYYLGMARGKSLDDANGVKVQMLSEEMDWLTSYAGIAGANGVKARLLPEEDRTRIALDLLRRKTPGFDAKELLYYAILWGSFTLADALRDAGVGLSRNQRYEIGWEEAIWNMEAADGVKALTRLMDLMEKQRKKLRIDQREMKDWIERTSKSFEGNIDILRLLSERADASRVSEMSLMKKFVSKERMELLDVCAQIGWIKDPERRDKLIDCAMGRKKDQALAWLLDYKNRTADFAAEEEWREKKRMRQLSESPGSVRAMRRIWNWKKQGDGTLCLTSYKGKKVDVAVPEKIGRNVVTALEGTFNARTHAANQAARKAITSVRLPETIRRIGRESFAGCSSLTNMMIPEGVTSIGEKAFWLCGSLTSVTIPEGVTSIGEKAFWLCSSLTSVTIPDSVTSIGRKAFYDCSSLTSARIPEGVTSIEERVFYGCSSLAGVTIPEGVTDIGNCAFARCSSLASVIIPEGVTSIGDYAFAAHGDMTNTRLYPCSSLASVTIPDSVTSIGRYAFDNCENITIHASAGSYAKRYARNRGISFEKI